MKRIVVTIELPTGEFILELDSFESITDATSFVELFNSTSNCKATIVGIDDDTVEFSYE